MHILGIETSCDETAVAVVKDGTEVLSSVIASSHEFHAQFGGVLPELASRKQLELMIPTLNEATKNHPLETIDAIAVTVGPGLIGSLLIGVECAKTIAMVTNKPIISVNHVLAHPYANFLTNQKSKIQNLKSRFPAIALVVSGGHTELFLMNSEKEMKWLGGTIDDAAGEAFDKSARLLGLGNGGGKAIQELVETSKIQNLKSKIQLPRPMIHDNTLNFSFSGLKTAIQREWNKPDRPHIQDFAYEIQEAITDVLVKKTLRAVEQYSAQSILLGGGVSANKRLREKFEQSHSLIHPFTHFPELEYCTDNAAVIASYAYYHYSPQNYREISAASNLSIEVS